MNDAQITLTAGATEPCPATVPSPTWSPPPAFEGYVLGRMLGQGGMGVVYLAEDTSLDRLVAIKFIRDLEPGADARQRFFIEARAAARVQHPNVVSIYRVGELDGRPYLVTEFARGQPLERLVRPASSPRVLSIAIDLSRGLAAAHRKGVLHGDIKPHNVILTDDGGAKLLDFGLATLLEARDPGASGEVEVDERRDSTICGTPDFMPPEIWRGEPASRCSDVYSLGVLLFELAAGVTPFAGATRWELALAVLTRDAPSLAAAAPGIDPRLAAIVDRCLRPVPAERFATGDELREAFEQLARTGDATSAPEGNPYRGLRAFEADHRALFFGREAEIGVILERVRTEHFVLVTGDSGVGKSSICRAGVLPAITDGALGGGRRWSVCTLVPGKRPLRALAGALAVRLGLTPAELARRIEADREALAREFARHLGSAQGLLLFLDQTEELLTVADQEETAVVQAALAALAAGVPGVRMLGTLRADFLTRFAGLPALGEDLSRILYFLRPLSPERMRDVIVGPAESTGLRFESDELVDSLVHATAHADGGLPLLQFALAELWEARDTLTDVITEAALAAMGGVSGALARHADAVIAALRPEQRTEARRLLMRLVTLDDTRVRRSDVELHAVTPDARGALDALVRGRLLVAHDAEEGTAYEVGHEVLIRGWGSLRRWLAEDAEIRAARERLAAGAASWHRTRDALWSSSQLAELATLDPADWTPIEVAFVAASRRALDRRRWARRAAAIGVPLLVAAVYGGTMLAARHTLAAQVNLRVAEAHEALGEARRVGAELSDLRREAFRLFDEGHRREGEAAWARALGRGADLDRALARGGRAIEAGFAQDPGRDDVRALLGEALYERALVAEASRKVEQGAELVERFGLYDAGGDLGRRWNAPATLSIRSATPGARVSLTRFVTTESGAGRWESSGDLGALPIEHAEIAKGSYVLIFSAPGRVVVRYPLLADRGEQIPLDVDLPRAEDIPEGFVYVAPARFLFGSGGDEASRRGFFDTVPLHEVRVAEYLIRRTEITYADWIEYLGSLPPAERALRTPRVATKLGAGGGLDLEELASGGWRLALQLAGHTVAARSGEAFHYESRKTGAGQRWAQLPVTGISAEDAMAFASWLRATGRVPGARLCTEHEWELGARGADGRDFPHGNHLTAEEANHDETYAKDGMGPDEVGTHPASRSPLGLDDMSGNAFEWTTSTLEPGQFVARGGSYFHDQKTAQLANRNTSTPTLRDATLGARLCASLAPRGVTSAAR